ncbi:chemotaxis protein CheY [Candidatus Magnetomorum sp. HK-1]|nr:chemotaxis protein CheY [Candidatus Magnetomorum sp. HK-1]
MPKTKNKQKILIVDDTPVNIRVLVEVLKNEYKLSIATNGKVALNYAQDENPPDLILLDIMMPELDGYEVCKLLKSEEHTRGIPIIFITAMSEEKNETLGLELGAVDYIVKPINPRIVQARVKTHLELKRHQDHLAELVKEKTSEIVEAKMDIIYRLARAAEYRDNETGMHVIRMSHYCSIIAKAATLDEERCEQLFHAASMHDVGKIGIPDSILLKPGRLTEEEFIQMKTHTTIGGVLLDGGDSELLHMAQNIALTHHEKWNGTGYPKGLSGNDIPIEGRISAICDVFDALTSERPYKKEWSIEKTMNELTSQKGEHFDPDLLDLFVENLDKILDTKKRFADPR